MSRQRVLVVTQHAYPFHLTVRRNVDAVLDAGGEVDVLCLVRMMPGTASPKLFALPCAAVFVLISLQSVGL